jgi:nucleotide-binding universal stress UspA family protein
MDRKQARCEGFVRRYSGEDKNMDEQISISIHNVLLATDFSATANTALSYAAAIAGRYNSRLIVAHVINPEAFDLLESESGKAAARQARDEATRKIGDLLTRAQLPGESSEIEVAEGAVADRLLNIIQQSRVDLAVLGTHGRRAFQKMILGSITEEIFRIAPCPVLTVGPKTLPFSAGRQIRHVLYPAEYVPDTSKAAAYALSLAHQYDATLTVMNVREDMAATAPASEWFKPEREHWIQQHLPQGSDLRNRVRFHMGFGAAADSILEFTANANVDVIVMPVRQLDPLMAAHLPRPDTAYEVISRALCPVLTIR